MNRLFRVLLCLAIFICVFQVACISRTRHGMAVGKPKLSDSSGSFEPLAKSDKVLRNRAIPKEVCRISSTHGLPIPDSFHVLGGGRYIVYSIRDRETPDRYPVWLFLDLERKGPAKELWSLEHEALRQPKHQSYSLCRNSDPDLSLIHI